MPRGNICLKGFLPEEAAFLKFGERRWSQVVRRQLPVAVTPSKLALGSLCPPRAPPGTLASRLGK